ncbi:MAG: isoprenoid biosynthesis glyoxalase ElbB [Pseudomonadota bacterium]
MALKAGVLLSGCGVYDGSEIHEAVLTLLFLDRAGAQILCMAPNIDQLHVVNHLSGEANDEKRNVLIESARIARGDIKDLKDMTASDMDLLIVPGGFGAAKNLCSFAIDGPDATINPEVKRLIEEMIEAKKPIGALCIAPAVLARALGSKNTEVTIGNDAGTADAIESMGATHIQCGVKDIHVDEKNKIVTTPAYMLGPDIKNVAVGIEKLVAKVLELAAD